MHSKTKKIVFFVLPFLFFLILPLLASAAAFDYKPLENLPLDNGEATKSDFYDYVQQVYNFLIGAAGICALLMIVIGGFMYLTSAGNNSKMEKAKSVIADAIIGLLLVMATWLFLYTINPDLVYIKKLGSPSQSGTGAGSGAGTGAPGGAACGTPATSGSCAPAALSGSCFDSSPEVLNKASYICYKESAGNETIPSGVDVCADGNPVSIGLFQINMTVHKINGLDCPSAFSSKYTGSNRNCKVINQDLYNQCKTAAGQASINIKTACAVYSQAGNSFRPWSTNCN